MSTPDSVSYTPAHFVREPGLLDWIIRRIIRWMDIGEHVDPASSQVPNFILVVFGLKNISHSSFLEILHNYQEALAEFLDLLDSFIDNRQYLIEENEASVAFPGEIGVNTPEDFQVLEDAISLKGYLMTLRV